MEITCGAEVEDGGGKAYEVSFLVYLPRLLVLIGG